MNIDPKKGGKCWSCTYCEDIATQTNNSSGAYYRKCTKSGHEYIDTCKSRCGDYVWDGKHEEFFKTSVQPRSISFRWISALITTVIFGFLGYLLFDYSNYLSALETGAPASLAVINDAYLLEAIIIFAPFVLSVVWSVIQRRKIWIVSLLTILACTGVNSMIGEDTTPAHIPLFIAVIVIPYIPCLYAILKGKLIK